MRSAGSRGASLFAGGGVLGGALRLFRFAEPQPSRSIGLIWRRTSPRKHDFQALGRIPTEVGQMLAGRSPRRSPNGSW